MRKSSVGTAVAAAFAAWVATATAPGANAQSVESFYKGKTIAVVIGYAPGGTYDATARLLTRHMGRHIPGEPAMVPQSMPGSGSVKAILHTYGVAPRDGTALAMVARSYPIDPLFNPESEKYDPVKFNPIGSTSTEVSTAVTWHTSPVKTLGDLLKPGVSITAGATGTTDDTGRFPQLTKNLTGADIKIVLGYPGGNDVTLALEKGEVDARFGWSWGSVKSRSKQWLDEKKINIILQMALKKAPDLPDTPFIMDFAKTELDRQAMELIFAPQSFAWPLIAPPDVPADRLAALRRAFAATMKDEKFIAEAEKLAIEVDPVSGEEMQATIKRILAFPSTAVERAQALTTAPR